MKYAEKLLEQGRQEGRSEGRREIVEKLLTLKFGAVSVAHQAQLEQATLEQLEHYAARVLSAGTIAEVFAD